MCQRLTESSQKVCWAKYDRRWGDWQNARKNIYIKASSSLEGFLNLHLTKRWRPRLRGDSLLQRVWQGNLLSWSRGEIAKHWHFGFCERAPRREDQERRLRMEEGSESCLGPLKGNNLLRITWYLAWVIVLFKASNYSRYLKARVVSPAMVKVSERKHPSYSWNQSHCHQGSVQTLVKSVIHCLRMLFAFICRKKHIFKREGLLWRNSILQILTQQSSCHA